MGSFNYLLGFWLAIGFCLGMVLGSFIKVLADRSLNKRSFRGRSYCTVCKHKLAWYDLFPVISYIKLGGRCRYCRKIIGREYFFVEIASGFVFLLIFLRFPLNTASLQDPLQLILFLLDLIFKIFFVSVLLVLFLTDLKKMFIPDKVVLPAIVTGFIYLVLFTVYKIWYLYFYLSSHNIGKYLLPPYSDYFQRHAFLTAGSLLGSVVMAVLIGSFFALIILITKGRGMGGGDVKLGAFIGLCLSFPVSLVALMLSFISGALFSLALVIFGKKHFGQSIPFGPFLVFGSIVSLLWGNQIVDWYLRIDKLFFL